MLHELSCAGFHTMHDASLPTGPAASAPLPAHDTLVLLASARALQRSGDAGQARPLLRGKNVGLLCEADAEPDARLFRDAAQALGAQVAHIRPSLSRLDTPQELQHTARLLGRLYDAVECQGLAPDIVQQIGAAAGVPVYDGLATAGHPTAGLAAQIDGDAAPADKRRLVLQAVLLQAIG